MSKLEVEAELLHKQIVLLTFEKQVDMNETLIRFQEYYENKDLAGTIFTLGMLKEQLIKDQGAFTYYDWVHGINFPSRAFKPFFQGLFDPLTPHESYILEMMKYRQDEYYVIAIFEGTKEGDPKTHEIAHAMYAVLPDYRDEVLDILKDGLENGLLEDLIARLRKDGYSEDTIWDECHAYMVEDDPDYDEYFDDGLVFRLQEAYYRYAEEHEVKIDVPK